MKSNHVYSGYTDFLKDKKFIQWQLMPDEELCVYWENFFIQHPELEKDLQQAISYLKNGALNKFNLGEIERIAIFSKMQKTIHQTKKTKRRRAYWYTLASAAAIVVIIFGISIFTPTPESEVIPDNGPIIGEMLNNEDIQLITSGGTLLFQNDVEVTLNEEGTAEVTQGNQEKSKITIAKDKFNSLVIPYGKRSTLTLTDGTKVWLNSGSVLEFPSHFNDKKREIRLASGEMYVEVAYDKEKTFHVQTTHFNVKAYGTKFNISNYAGSTQSVVLVEGSVSLQSEGHKELFIAPSEQAVYSASGTFDTQKVDAHQLTSWKDGYLTFEKTPMNEVLQQVGRFYNLAFDYGQNVDWQHRTCTGKIYLSEDLDNVMNTIAMLTSTKYEKENNKIFIKYELE